MKHKKQKVAIFVSFIFLTLFTIISQGIASYDVIVVRGDMPTDYVVASIYAGAKKRPLVLLDPDHIQDQIKDELVGYRSKGYQFLLIIGGESAISSNVENDLKSIGFIVNRLWDWNRYGTAARVSIDLWGEAEQVIVTNGEDYSSFLLAQRIALEKGSPILFIKNNTVPTETQDAIKKLGIKSVILVSNEQEASDALKSLGLTVQTIETISAGGGGTENETQEQNLPFYALLSLLLVAIILVSIKFRKGGKIKMFILTEDEEKMVEILKIHGRTEQSKLAKLTDFSKPRISRMLRSLEDRGVIEREAYKKTYKIKLTSKIA